MASKDEPARAAPVFNEGRACFGSVNPVLASPSLSLFVKYKHLQKWIMTKVQNEQVANNSLKAKQSEADKITLSELKENRNVRYKINVLIYDLCNIRNDKNLLSHV